jgi:type I restriction enzyme M protein
MPREKKINPPKTTAQRLDSLIKSARNKMRKDRELKTDLTRLPTLTWLMFLKFVDDMERVHEDEAVLASEPYQLLIDAPYRWRDWEADPAGITGPDLLSFINGEQSVRADGTQGPGLFAFLRGLRGNGAGRQRRDVVSAVFRDLRNYATSGYVLRDVINLINGIHFDSTEDIQTLGRMYCPGSAAPHPVVMPGRGPQPPKPARNGLERSAGSRRQQAGPWRHLMPLSEPSGQRTLPSM